MWICEHNRCNKHSITCTNLGYNCESNYCKQPNIKEQSLWAQRHCHSIFQRIIIQKRNLSVTKHTTIKILKMFFSFNICSLNEGRFVLLLSWQISLCKLHKLTLSIIAATKISCLAMTLKNCCSKFSPYCNGFFIASNTSRVF